MTNGPPTAVVCWKWVTTDADHERWAGVSDADRAALEIGLRLAGPGGSVTVVTVGPPAADAGLREALAAGASRAVRIATAAALTSAAVATAIAEVAAPAAWIVCGDASADRGSGAVPAFLAAELNIAQALGLVDVPTAGAPADGPLRVVRRLDGGRREVLDVAPPAVLSVEGAVGRLRRAGLRAELTVRRAPIDVIGGPAGPIEQPVAVQPYRPRARALPAPAGDALQRVRVLIDHGGEPGAGHTEVVVADPPAAAARLLAALRTWGHPAG